MVDPDGNRVRLVTPGHDGIMQLAIRMGVRSVAEHRRFYGDILGFAEQPWPGGLAFRLGDSLLVLEEDRAATVDPARQAPGWRYITLQITDIDAVHGALRSKGVREGLAPVTPGKRSADIDDPRSGRQLGSSYPAGPRSSAVRLEQRCSGKVSFISFRINLTYGERPPWATAAIPYRRQSSDERAEHDPAVRSEVLEKQVESRKILDFLRGRLQSK